MKRKLLLLKISFILILIVAAIHTTFILLGGPNFPSTNEFAKMFMLMRTLEFDTGGNIYRSMQDIMDGFNIIVSIFLISFPALSLVILSEIKDNRKAVNKLTIVSLFTLLAFFLTSLMLLAVGGTVIALLVCLLLLISLLLKTNINE